MNGVADEVFGPVVHAYTRAQAIEDGEQIDISELAKEAGFRFPVYMTRGAYEATVAAGGTWVDSSDGEYSELQLPCGQDPKGRMWDVLNVLLFRIRASRGQNLSEMSFAVSVYGYDGRNHSRTVRLLSQCGPIDYENPAPALTIMLPEER